MIDCRIRVLVAKPGLEGHERGANTVASVLRDHGIELIDTRLHHAPEVFAKTAVQEHVDIVGLCLRA